MAGWASRKPGRIDALLDPGRAIDRAGPWALACLLFVAVLLYGGSRADIALVFAGLWGGFLLAALHFFDGTQALARLHYRLWVPAGAFLALVLINLVAQVGPEGGPHAWAYVTARPAWVLDRSLDMIEVVKLSGLACLFLVGCLIGLSRTRSRAFITALIVLGCVYGVGAFVWLGMPPLFLVEGAPADNGGRLAGSFLSANTAATFFAVLFLVALGQVVSRWRGFAMNPGMPLDDRIRRLWLPSLATAVFVVDLMMTGSRSAALATMVVAVVWLGAEVFGSNLMSGRARLGFAVVAALLLVLMMWSSLHVLERYGSVGADTATRRNIFEAHWQLIAGEPWRGFGLGGFNLINQAITNPSNFKSLWNLTATHNAFLQWVEEAGAPATCAICAAIGFPLTVAARGSASREATAGLQRSILAASVVIIIHSLTDFSIQVYAVAGMWAVLLGMASGSSLFVGAKSEHKSLRNGNEVSACGDRFPSR